MSTGTLNWYEDRGFELDVEAAEDDVAIRLVAVPVPADGTAELRAGVQLNPLDILFKASIEIQGEPGQLHEARVQLVSDDGASTLEIDARCEDVETGDILPLRLSVPIAVPVRAPESGGPRPIPQNEDELDWEDETTLEQLVVNAPETPSTTLERDEEPRGRRSARLAKPEPEPPPKATKRGGSTARSEPGKNGKKPKSSTRTPQPLPEPPRSRPPADSVDAAADPARRGETPADPARRGESSRPGSDKGFHALLKALARLDDEEEDEPSAEVPRPAAKATPAKPAPRGKTPAPATPRPSTRSVTPARPPPRPVEPEREDESDQLLGADGEARGLLDILVNGDHLELEGDAEVDGLVSGVAKILALPLSSESKATKLSTWLLEQEEVADLFIGDEDLAEILERW